MSRFTRAETRRFELSDEDWVVIRRLTRGDKEAVRSVGMVVRIATDRKTAARMREDGSAMHFDVAASNAMTMTRAIAAWGGPGFCALHDHDEPDAPSFNGVCRPRPLTRATLDALDDQTGERIVAFINEMNPDPSTEEDALP